MKVKLLKFLCLLLFAALHSMAQDLTPKIGLPYARAIDDQAVEVFMTIYNPNLEEMILEKIEYVAADQTGVYGYRNGKDLHYVTKLHIPPKTASYLKPNGFHIRLTNLKEPLKEGQTFSLVLHFAQGDNRTTLTTDVPVKPAGFQIKSCPCQKI